MYNYRQGRIAYNLCKVKADAICEFVFTLTHCDLVEQKAARGSRLWSAMC